MLAARSLLWLIATLAVVAVLWLTLLSGGGHSPTALPAGTTLPSGTTSGEPAAGGYKNPIDAARSSVGQANQDAQRAADSAAGTP